MNKQNYNGLQAEAEKRFKKRDKRKDKKMKVSGGSIKQLQKIITNKS